MLSWIPDKITVKMNPVLGMLLKLRRDWNAVLSRISRGEDQAHQQSAHPTIFQEVMHSDLPPQEKTLHRLTDEAQNLIAAGLETTAGSLSKTCFYIINQPRVCERLRDELCIALPDPSAPTDWLQLEKLPCLRACIREGIRLFYATAARNPRVHHKSITYKDWLIPAGTPVSMTFIDVQNDEELFPNSRSFIPERWLDNPKAPNGSPL
ncbi:MAG: hypothetical protein M1816_000972 [Peltula sp. TS41687]|nr:MAG: hypothetical protein M1816_000972 [Peltula sp. TS41687]